MRDPTTMLRCQLCAAGYSPLPLFGKAPPVKGKNNSKKGLGSWQNLGAVTPEMIEMWARTWPDSHNTGVLTRHMPTLDLDILNEDAARAAENLARERYEESGYVLARVGLPPKRAIPFRTIEPFTKIVVNIIASTGNAGEKVKFLGDGQQVACFGIHPDTRRPYTWHGGEPGRIKLHELPYIREAEARQLVDDIVALLVRDFGYTRAAVRPNKGKRKGNGIDADAASAGAADWQYLFNNIREGKSLHDSLRDLAAKFVAAGTSPGAVVNQLRALMESSTAARDDRWKARYKEIPRLVESAVEKLQTEDAGSQRAAPGPPCGIEETLDVFRRWLVLGDLTPVYAVLGTIAANLLPGDPVWLGLIAPPSSAKTEILNSLTSLPYVVSAATLTPAGLLSGTPRKQQHSGAKGGLLRQIGAFGILMMKDFGSVLSMRPDAKAEVLAALREIYDGAWTRVLGTEGGRMLEWKGKVGLVFGATGVMDSHHSVISGMGDRFLLNRLKPDRGQFQRALQHAGAATTTMRQGLREAVARLFATRRPEPQPLADEEFQRLDRVVSLAVRLRGAVDRDRRTRELEYIYGAEGTARLGLTLERLLAGLDTLGVAREVALNVVETVALDSVPPLRRRAYEFLLHTPPPAGKDGFTTRSVAAAMGLHTNTARRAGFGGPDQGCRSAAARLQPHERCRWLGVARGFACSCT
jgi:hypothetical protein